MMTLKIWVGWTGNPPRSFSPNQNICRKMFSRSLFQKEGFEIWGCSFVSELKLRSTSSAKKNFAVEITWITWKTEQNLEIWPFLKWRLEMWVWESGRKIDPVGQTGFGRVTPVAGPVFEAKIERYFLESFFLERNYCPRTAFSGSNSRSILSNQVISWNGSRVDRCPLGREITARTCSLPGNEGTPPDFERFFLEKRPWKRFSTNVLIRGDMNPLHSQLMSTKL